MWSIDLVGNRASIAFPKAGNTLLAQPKINRVPIDSVDIERSRVRVCASASGIACSGVMIDARVVMRYNTP